MMRNAKTDINHAEIRDALRSVPGCRVFDTARLGGGFPDLVVGFMGRISLLEIKDGSKPPSKRKLTPDEKRFHEQWEHLPVFVVNDVEEAFFAVGVGTEPPPF